MKIWSLGNHDGRGEKTRVRTAGTQEIDLVARSASPLRERRAGRLRAGQFHRRLKSYSKYSRQISLSLWEI